MPDPDPDQPRATPEPPDAHRDAEASSDESLMRDVLDGNEAALGHLYRRYAPLAMAVCLRVLRDHGRAEETTIDVFAELWRKPDRFDAARGSLRGFVLLLARSRSIDRLRSVGTEPKAKPLHGVLSTADDAAPPPSSVASTHEQATLVRSAVSDLDPQHREALEAAFFEGLSHTEVAQKLGKPLGTIKSHIRQALSRLRDRLADPLGPDAREPDFVHSDQARSSATRHPDA